MKAPRGATWFCCDCRTTSAAYPTCHPKHAILVEACSIERRADGVAVDVTMYSQRNEATSE